MIEIQNYSTTSIAAVQPAGFLSKEDFRALELMAPELQNTFEKKQVWRGEAEMRASVLNDMTCPTRAAKYWQAVREQDVFFGQLVELSFDYRRTLIAIQKKQKELDNCEDELDSELLRIDIEELNFKKKNQEIASKNRMRELKLWSKIKAELDDGSFDSQDFDSHKMESLLKTSGARIQNMLSSGGAQGDPNGFANVLAVHKTAQRLVNAT